MKKFIAWLRNIFATKVPETVVAAAEQAAIDLEKYQPEYADAQRLVREAEAKYAAEPKSGSKKWAMVTALLSTGWTHLKPHVVSFLTAVAVTMLKKELADRAIQPPPTLRWMACQSWDSSGVIQAKPLVAVLRFPTSSHPTQT